MKRFAAFLIVLVMSLSAANGAFAQDEEEWIRYPYRFVVNIEVGMGLPSKPNEFNDLWNESLPVTLSLGYSIVPWVEVAGFFTYATWSIGEIPAKSAIGVVGTQEISGGKITTMLYGGSAKIMPLPNSRLTPFVEVGGGVFSASAENLEVENTFQNTLGEVNGPAFVGSGGLEYGINDGWNMYTKFVWTVGFNNDFAPGDLVRNLNDPPTEGGALQYGAVILGIKMKI